MALLAYPADIFLSHRLKNSNAYAAGELETWKDLVDHRIQADIVIYGSSRACHHIDPAVLKDSLGVPAYNLGITGHRFEFHKLRHDILMEGKQPKTIIYSLDLFTLQTRTDLYNPDQFLPYIRTHRKISNVAENYEGYTPADYTLPLIRYYGKKEAIVHIFKSLFRKKLPPSRTNGFQGLNRAMPIDFGGLRSGEITVDEPTLKAFENFLLDCKSKNIEVVLVYTPEFIEAQELTKNREEIISLYRGISKRTGVPFIDYSDHPINFQKEKFADRLHLNAQGAREFSAILAQDIRALWMNQK